MKRGWIALFVALALPAANDPLISAVKDGLHQEVQALLGKRSNVRATDENGATALAWAVMRDDLAAAAALVKAHADPNVADVNGVTPLRIAIDNHSTAMVRLLLENGTNPNQAGAGGETPLMAAIHHGSIELARRLLERGADPNARESQFGQTALMWAAARDARLVRLLLDHGADVRAVTRSWDITSPIYTPPTVTLGVTGIPWNHDGEFTVKAGGLHALMFAVQGENIESAKSLLDAGVDVNRPSADGGTALLAALYNWQLTTVTTIFGAGSGVRFSPNLGMAALLLDRGARVKISNGSGYTPLHALLLSMAPAGRSGNPGERGSAEAPAFVRRMLEMGADPNLATIYPTAGPASSVRVNPLSRGSTPYHAAAVIPDGALAELMASHGANPNIVRKDGHTPFTVAVMADNLSVVKAMAAHGADLKKTYDPQDKLADPVAPRAEARRNQNALHIAAAAGATRVAEFLAGQDVPLHARNGHGETPLQLANDQEVFRYKRLLEGPLGIGDPKAIRSTATSDAIRKAMARTAR